MKSFGKGLFWIGFILLMGVVIGYLITMLAGVMAFASWVTALTFCGLILVGGIFMLIGRASERKGEIKRQMKDLQEAEKNFNSTEATGKTTI
ncbi:hypothetical protein [uncultured Duncaniella sp.]|uniref:hypothetical protein n=1 Tax=uncultured Duncaniella sp. TaxID=2768039 RepID=UPI0025EFC1FD|nr:hypothetical protein [uncultured Duncaniella sp.]MDE5916220.1 hypothetical protein [Duncaniella sp.]